MLKAWAALPSYLILPHPTLYSTTIHLLNLCTCAVAATCPYILAFFLLCVAAELVSIEVLRRVRASCRAGNLLYNTRCAFPLIAPDNTYLVLRPFGRPVDIYLLSLSLSLSLSLLRGRSCHLCLLGRTKPQAHDVQW